MKNICIDLGGTNLKSALIIDEKVVEFKSIPSGSHLEFDTLMLEMEKLIRNFMRIANADEGSPPGLGISMPGIIDVDRNRVIAINKKHEKAVDFNFNAWSKDKFGLALAMENDARAALLGEWKYGAGKAYNDIVMMTLGTGIGGAAMINGKLIHGKHYQAGCLGGHFTIDFKGDRCNCGNTGCVEATASSWSLKRVINKIQEKIAPDFKIPDDVDFEKLFELKRMNDETADRVVEHCLKAWSAGIVSLIHAYDPEIVILSGGVMKSQDEILPYIRDYVAKYAWTPLHSVSIVGSGNVDNIALWGMNYLMKSKNEEHKNE